MNRVTILSAAIAAGLHAGLLGFRSSPRPAPPVADEKPSLLEWTACPVIEDVDPPPAADSLDLDQPLPPSSPPVPRGADYPSSAPDLTRDPIVVTPHDLIRGELGTSVIPLLGPGGPAISEIPLDSIHLDNTPRVLVRIAPVRPVGASAERETVTVDFVVGKTGAVMNARVVDSTDSRYEEACLKAVKRWRFEPGMRQNVPVAFRMQQTFVFTRQD